MLTFCSNVTDQRKEKEKNKKKTLKNKNKQISIVRKIAKKLTKKG
jgi:hypothetical protein